jgi:membrane-bound ClpP family serine protease
MMQYGVADIMLPPAKLQPITPEEQAKGKWPAFKNLLFTYPYFEKFSRATIAEYQLDWKGQFFAFLSNPVISSLIFLGMILGFYIEINTPGFGVAGTLALTCLFLIILSSFALEVANWLELIFLVSGLLILLVELFVLPTFGLLGVIGIILFFAGLLGMMLPGAGSINYEFDTQTFNAAGEIFIQRLAWICGTLVAAFFLILIISRYMTFNLGPFRRFVLVGHEQEGYSAVEKTADLPPAGTQGIAMTPLRPSGKIIISDKIYDAISYGIFIEKDKKIVVDRVEGSSIVIHEIPEP